MRHFAKTCACAAAFILVMSAMLLPAYASDGKEDPSVTPSLTTGKLVLSYDGADASTIASDEYTSGMVQVFLGYVFDDGSFDPWHTFPGFAVNETTVITSPEATVEPDGELYKNTVNEKQADYRKLGKDLTDGEAVLDRLVYRVYNGESLLKASKVHSDGNITVLSVTGMLDGAYPLYDAVPNGTEKAYAVGIIPGSLSPEHFLTENDIVCQKIEVVEMTASGSLRYKTESSCFFNHCPVVNKDGTLIGVTAVCDGTGSTIPLETVKTILDGLGIRYETRALLPDPGDLTALDAALSEADALDLGRYTAETTEKVRIAVADAKKLLEKSVVTQVEADEAELAIRNALSGLLEKPKKFSLTPYVIAAILFVVLVLAVWFIIRVAKKKKEIEEDNEEDGSFHYNTNPVQLVLADMGRKIGKKEKAEKKPAGKVKPERKTEEKVEKKPVAAKIEEPATSPNEVYEEYPTMVLSKEAYSVVRLKTGEEKTIEHTPFVIGRSLKDADFIVRDNDTVGRRHAVITEDGGEYYITDLSSINGTRLNGEQLLADSAYVLKPGRFTLSNEEFEFRKIS